MSGGPEAERAPRAMPAPERERLIRIGLGVVLAERAAEVPVERSADSVWVGALGVHRFGFPIDAVLGDDPPRVLAHDVERLVDELCESSIAWSERLPECPLHPGSHALEVALTGSTITATCPVTGRTIRSTQY